MSHAKKSDSNSQDSLDSSFPDDDKPHEYTISQALFEELQAMGFSGNAIKKSIVAGCIDRSTCVQWITMHADHPELDAPLSDGVEIVIKCKKVLTEAEREQKVKELQDKIKEKNEEKKRESHRKKMERAEMWRKSLEVKEEMDEVRRQMHLSEVKRNKASEHAAYRQVRINIIADRYIRQGKGVDEAHALAAREYDERQLQQRQAAAAHLKDLKLNPEDYAHKTSESKWNLSSVLDGNEGCNAHFRSLYAAPAPTMEELPALISDIHSIAEKSEKEQCLRVLHTILSNIRNSPFDIKKRTLKTSSKSLTQHVLRHTSAVRLLRLCNLDLGVDADSNEVLVCTTVVIHLLNEVLKGLE